MAQHWPSKEYSVEKNPIDPDLLKAAAGDDSVIFIDFDHTLFACNSTELFIAYCKPSGFVAIIDFLIRRCIPWKLTRLRNWFRVRDYVCCLAIMVLSPWNVPRWRRAAPGLFAQHLSLDMTEALRAVSIERVTIVTFGLQFIVRSLLRRSQWSVAPLLATPPLATASYFALGKLGLVSRSVSLQAVAESTFVTDSLDDDDLLLAAGNGILIEPQGHAFKAAEQLYLPFRYTSAAKYTTSYVLDQIIFVEFLLLVISISPSFQVLASMFLIALPLYVSIMCIYEIGYYENDVVAAKAEANPRVSARAASYQAYPIQPSAWIWGLLTGAFGLTLAFYMGRLSRVEVLTGIPEWIIGLGLLRILFHFYNKPDLRNRLHIYPILQLMKFLPILILFRPTNIGSVIILCQIATMWAIYLTYRWGGRSKDIEKELYRAVMLGVGLCLLCAAGSFDLSASWFQVIAISLWLAARLSKAPFLKQLRRRSLQRQQAANSPS